MQIHMSGILHHSHDKKHIPHAFSMPAGATVVTIAMKTTVHTSAPVQPQVSLTVSDPEGVRGARHNNSDQSLRLTALTSTPGYTAGALQEGVWTVWIDVHRLMEPDTIEYTIDISIGFDAVDNTPTVWEKGVTAPRGAGWYRGDLHGHTIHSDAIWTVEEYAQNARHLKLDFVTLTDHNTVSPLAELESYAGDDLLTMGGLELTTYYGHALGLGVREWLGWRVGVDAPDMPSLARAVMDAGATFVIAHPNSIGDPWCTGCDWQYGDMMPGPARLVEVWNGDWGGGSGNEQTIQLWYTWLNQGYRMAATAGTDTHGPMASDSYGFNVVYAEALTESAILAGLRAGHAYVSAGPTLDLTADNGNGTHAIMGDLIEGESVTVTVRWSDTQEGEYIRVIVDGMEHAHIPAASDGEHIWSINTAKAHWTTVEIRGADGGMRAVANPIRLGAAESWR